MSTPTYATHMLDGLDFLYKKSDDGLKSLHEVLGFFRKMATAEKKFGGEIQSIAKRYTVSKPFMEEIGTIRAGWDSMQQELENIGTKHNTLSDSITKELVDAMNAFMRRKETDQKKLVKDGGTLTREMKSSLAALQSAKNKFISACKSADSAAGAYSKAKADGAMKPKDVNRLSQKATKSSDSANATEKEYVKQLEKTNQKQHLYYDQELPSLLKQFQDWEEDRVSFLRQQFERYATFYCGFPPFMDMSTKAVKKVCDEIDVAKDTQTFLEQNRTGVFKPPDILYEPYTPQNPEFVVSNSSSPPSSAAPRRVSITASPSVSPRKASISARPASPVAQRGGGGGGGASGGASGGAAGGNIVETNVPISKEIEVNENDYGLTAADAALPAEFKQAKLKKQLKELKDKIRAERKTAKGIEKLVKFYAADPVAQEKTSDELKERKEKIAKMREIQSGLEAELAKIEEELNPGGASTDPPPQDHHEKDPHEKEPVEEHTSHEEENHREVEGGEGGQGGQGGQGGGAAGGAAGGGGWETGEIVEEEVLVMAIAKGTYEYVASNETELSFKEGEIMNITDQDDSGWWFAEIGERSGFVPKNYLEVVEQF